MHFAACSCRSVLSLCSCCWQPFLLQPARRSAHRSPRQPTIEVNRIARQLYCPVCENTPLDVCPTEACRQWRDLIRQQLSEGWSEDRIQQYFVEQYGARVLAEPPRTGLNWLVYVLPPLIILAGAFILFRSFRSGRLPDSRTSEGMRPTRRPAAEAGRTITSPDWKTN